MNKIDRLYFSIVNRCNLSCSFCYEKNKMFESDIDMLYKISNENKINQLILFGGEPLLNLGKIKDIVMKLHNKVEEIIITTNGTLLTKKILEDLNFENVYFQVTLYSNNIPVIIHNRVFYHVLITGSLIDDQKMLFHLKDTNKWISIVKGLKQDIVKFIKFNFDIGLLKKENFRVINSKNKKCGFLNKVFLTLERKSLIKNCVDNIINNRVIDNNIDKNCEECTNEWCDSCVCYGFNIFLCNAYKEIERRSNERND